MFAEEKDPEANSWFGFFKTGILNDASFPFLSAFVAGAVAVIAFAPFSQPWIALLVLAYAYQRLIQQELGLRQAAWQGFCFGLGFFGVGVSWVYVSLHVFGGMSFLLAGLPTLLFCAFLALYPTLVALIFVHLRRGNWHDILLFTVLVTFADWCRSWLFSGFPWLSWGYSQVDSPLYAFAPVIGLFGVTALLACASASLVFFVRSVYTKTETINAKIIFIIWLFLGSISALLHEKIWTNPVGAPVKVALIQGNIPQQLKWEADYLLKTLNTYEKLIYTALPNASLIVLPETAFPIMLGSIQKSFLYKIRDRASLFKADFLFGIPTGGNNSDYFNSAISMGISPIQKYDKFHLVPFGERTPTGFSWFMRQLNLPMSSFSPGKIGQEPLKLGHIDVGVNICYEDAFGSEIAQSANRAGILVNMSNTAWFGRSLAQAQHLQIAQMRALETGRPMLRATNTGMTAIINAEGDIVGKLKPFTQNILYAEVQAREGITPYMFWRDTPVVILILSGLFYFCYQHIRTFIKKIKNIFNKT